MRQNRKSGYIILVVDDMTENIDVLTGILENEYEIKVALNGERALNIAAGPNPPDLILLDIMMPHMDVRCPDQQTGLQTALFSCQGR